MRQERGLDGAHGVGIEEIHAAVEKRGVAVAFEARAVPAGTSGQHRASMGTRVSRYTSERIVLSSDSTAIPVS